MNAFPVIVAFLLVLAISCGITWYITQGKADKRLHADRDAKWALLEDVRADGAARYAELYEEYVKLGKNLTAVTAEKVEAQRDREEIITGQRDLSGSCGDEARWT